MKQWRAKVERAADKVSTLSRISRAEHVGTVGPASAIWQAQPTMKDLGTHLVDAGSTLSEDDAAVVNLEAALAAARTKRSMDIVTYDAAYNAYAAGAEHFAATTADLQALGLTPASDTSFPLAAPLGIATKLDPKNGLVDIRVKCAPGLHHCRIEIASDQAMTQHLTLLPGDGARQSVAGLAAGTWWIRAAHVRATGTGGFVGPVAVIVK
jgi:hypothetical protein